ncbi:uncharacterized protein BCR38DRAFT_461783 [Pseudomassariella vexata]|uniref:Septation initiation network scaffold protein cdc11 n=1 Tax=Pseudomassariella vexata TaxID=1141098 RepID=A0A1Y2DA35_9PEZI|nr:uncharacterized protein BCR38DRAFT_461783 [Pseudomassariella vexata]ORY56130.1 hypothetical protein BCR38DRAFT_461783 [Pseudomassariella vexata]
MDHAWLDSLSEDWVSQPRSDNSHAQLPTFSSPSSSRRASVREQLSKMPRPNPNSSRLRPTNHDDGPHALSERSSNEINIPGSQCAPSKLSQGIKASQRGRHLSRSVSASTTASVIHNTVQHKSLSASPLKSRDQVPEWKRRLLYGEIAYGESKDLFSSAGTGLENMFRPPAPVAPEADTPPDDTVNETTLPSSPPPYRRRQFDDHDPDITFESSGNDFSAIPAPRVREMKYKRNDESFAQFNRPDGSTAERSLHAQETASREASETSFTSMSAKFRMEASRKASGKSDVRNEHFSPILISRRNAEDGRVSFAPVDLPADQLQKKLEKLRQNQMLLDSEPDSSLDQGLSTAGDDQDPEDTDDYARHGGFLNVRRGGRSAEDSFQHRLLSPPLNTDTSEMLPESSLQASTPKQFPTIRTERFASVNRKERPNTPPSPVQPRGPNPSPEKQLQPPQAKSGSPLKLFGPYDTFTNQTLLRRISQFEDQMADSPERSIDQSAQPVNKFGSGELDDYTFNEDISLYSSERSQMDNDKENVAPEENPLPPSKPIKFDISHHSATSNGGYLMVRRSRQKSSATAPSSRPSFISSASHLNSRPGNSSETSSAGYRVQATPQRDISEAKRPRTSPSKDPTPKRRRTLHRSDIAYGMEERPAAIESVLSSHYQMQSAMAKKRMDARLGDAQPPAHPTVMSMRQILRPRTPTPSQRSSTQRERAPLADINFSADSLENGSSLEGSQILVQDFAIEGSRKTSIKTEDFFIEANKIMAMIRNKARPNGLNSVEESEAEGNVVTPDELEDSYQESTREPFSRPPSREGRPVPRMPARQEDPELINRLRKYEEDSEMGDLIAYSIRSMGLAREAVEEETKLAQSVQESIRSSEMRHSTQAVDEIISDLSNVRISRNPDAPASSAHADFPSQGSRYSGSSSSHSMPTVSSQGSDSRRLIVPDLVTGLIGEKVGNMVLDKENKVWMKMKTPKPASKSRNFLPSEDSEEDPFASIPDLSVDVNRENENLGLKTAPLDDLEQFVQDEFSPAPSSVKKSRDAKSIMSHTKETFTRIQQTLRASGGGDDEDIEHEITIHEDRMQRSSPSRRRNLTITFSSPIASIIQDVMPQQSDETNAGDESSVMDQSVGDITAESLRRGRRVNVARAVGTNSNKSRSRSRSEGAARRSLSVRGRAFMPRPISRIDEQDEEGASERGSPKQRQVSIRGESTIVGPDEHEKCKTSVSFIITTPGPTRHLPPPTATPTIGRHVGTYSLSPLSDFTMNQADQSCGLEVSYVVGDNYLVTGDGSKNIMSQAIRNLVEKITEVEPYEPDWDAMPVLEINDKQLKSLHKLDEFCGNIITLDASNNSIRHLDGVPESVRNLKLSHNHISELAAWGHLMNLQYLDISDNQITSLHAFKELVHLRSLRADNNQITSLDGIKFHDSLQVLRVRANLIEHVDLDGTRMERLTELDLEGNQISTIRNIEQLPSLSTLNVEHNQLSSFGPTMNQTMTCLKYLKLSHNALTTLDLSAFPAIRLLHADRNHITALTGFRRAQRLDSLSLREQKGSVPLDPSFLTSAYEVRKLYLSGNLLTTFNPLVDFLNLQYLELANCGLQSLSDNFGQLMPNLRTLNLNFNAIEDLSPLRYIPRLKKLLVTGNRLDVSTGVIDILAEFPHLSKLDTRDNPSTLGFYPPLQSLVPLEQDADYNPFVLPEANTERDEIYAARLDLGTKKRRRLYEIMLTQRCQKLKVLDGLPVDRQKIKRKDAVWETLVESGAVSEKQRSESDSKQSVKGE